MPSWFDSLSNLFTGESSPPPAPAKRVPTMRAATPQERALSYVLGDVDTPQEKPPPQIPRMRAPTWSERITGAMQSGLEAVQDNPAIKALMFAAGTSPEEQAARFTDPRVADPPMKMGVALSPRQTPQALAQLVRVAEGTEVAPGALDMLKQAVAYYAKKYPRLTSHLESVTVQPTLKTPLTATGSASANYENLISGLVNDVGPRQIQAMRQPVGRINVSAEALRGNPTLQEAYDIMGHELGHSAQMLSDPSRYNRAYKQGVVDYGYEQHPAESMANLLGRRGRAAAERQTTPWAEMFDEATQTWQSLEPRVPNARPINRDRWRDLREQFDRWEAEPGQASLVYPPK